MKRFKLFALTAMSSLAIISCKTVQPVEGQSGVEASSGNIQLEKYLTPLKASFEDSFCQETKEFNLNNAYWLAAFAANEYSHYAHASRWMNRIGFGKEGEFRDWELHRAQMDYQEFAEELWAQKNEKDAYQSVDLKKYPNVQGFGAIYKQIENDFAFLDNNESLKAEIAKKILVKRLLKDGLAEEGDLTQSVDGGFWTKGMQKFNKEDRPVVRRIASMLWTKKLESHELTEIYHSLKYTKKKDHWTNIKAEGNYAEIKGYFYRLNQYFQVLRRTFGVSVAKGLRGLQERFHNDQLAYFDSLFRSIVSEYERINADFENGRVDIDQRARQLAAMVIGLGAVVKEDEVRPFLESPSFLERFLMRRISEDTKSRIDFLEGSEKIRLNEYRKIKYFIKDSNSLLRNIVRLPKKSYGINFISTLGIVDDKVLSGQMVVAKHKTRNLAVVSFRGTESITDAGIDALAGILGEKVADKFDPTSLHGGSVHPGFLVSFWALRHQLTSMLENLKPTGSEPIDIWVTGHSLGGALATVATAYLANMKNASPSKTAHWRLAGTTTYGSPRVGDDSFYKNLETKAAYQGFSFHRFVNKRDVVTKVPKVFMGYQHVGNLAHLSADKKMYDSLLTEKCIERKETQIPIVGSRVTHHFMDRYFDVIGRNIIAAAGNPAYQRYLQCNLGENVVPFFDETKKTKSSNKTNGNGSCTVLAVPPSR